MSDSVWPHRWLPTRHHRPWDSPGKNTGVGCHFLLQCMKMKSEREVAQSCLTLSDPMDCRLPGSSIHEIFQARVLEWGAIAFSAMNFRVHEKSWYWISHMAGANLYHIPGPWTSTVQQGVSKCSSAVSHPSHHSHYLLNHALPCPVCGKIVFHESSPWCQKGLDYYPIILRFS